MADKLYSVDDIINEYSGKGGSDDGKKESVDELLENFRKNDPTETVTLHNTDIFGKINDEAAEKSEKAAKSEGAFEEKYGKLSEKMNEVAMRESETPEKVVKGQGRERSFSEKIESGFDDDKKAEKSDSLSQRLKSRKKAGGNGRSACACTKCTEIRPAKSVRQI